MAEQSEFLSPQQCFIVYDDSTKKVAISLRNRLSQKDIKCTIWDEKQFKDNEARMSNFNRLLILNDEIAEEYLAAPTIQKNEITEYSYYKREGRVASISLSKELDIKIIKDNLLQNWDKINKALASDKKENESQSRSTGGFWGNIQNAVDTNVKNLGNRVNDVMKGIGVSDRMVKGIAAGGVIGLGLVSGMVPALIGLYGYGWNLLTEKDIKLALLFTAAREFELKYFDDFVNAK